MKVYCVDWSEYEENWGSRPGGTSYSTTAEKRKSYMAKVAEMDKSSKFHSLMPLRQFEINDEKLFAKAMVAGGTYVANRG